MSYFRLKTKFMFLIVGMATFMAVVLVTFLQTSIRDKLIHEIEKRGIVLAEYTASMNMNSILTGDLRSIQINIIDIKKENKESVDYIYILDRNKNVIAHTFGDIFPANLQLSNSVRTDKNFSIQPIIIGGHNIEDIGVKSSDNELIEVHIGMKQEIIKQTVNEITFWIMGVIIFLLIICFFVATFFSLLITREISSLSDAALKIEGGDFSINMEADGDDEISELKRAMNKMAANLKELVGKTKSQNLELEDWQKNVLMTKSKLNDLNIILRNESSSAELANKSLTFLAEFLGAGVGIIHNFDPSKNILYPLAKYACLNNSHIDSAIALGEGLVGQVALERKSITLDNVPQNYLPVDFTIAQIDPINIMILPIVHNTTLVGVLELGSLKKFYENDFDFLNQAVEGIAVAISVNRSREIVDKLLEQTQSQAEELRRQQEELQQTNEELLERTKFLNEMQKVKSEKL